jgi:hypothetical protein
MLYRIAMFNSVAYGELTQVLEVNIPSHRHYDPSWASGRPGVMVVSDELLWPTLMEDVSDYRAYGTQVHLKPLATIECPEEVSLGDTVDVHVSIDGLLPGEVCERIPLQIDGETFMIEAVDAQCSIPVSFEVAGQVCIGVDSAFARHVPCMVRVI